MIHEMLDEFIAVHQNDFLWHWVENHTYISHKLYVSSEWDWAGTSLEKRPILSWFLSLEKKGEHIPRLFHTSSGYAAQIVRNSKI